MSDIEFIEHLGSYRMKLEGLHFLVRCNVAHRLLELGRDMPKGLDTESFMRALIHSNRLKDERATEEPTMKPGSPLYEVDVPAVPERRRKIVTLGDDEEPPLRRVAVISKDPDIGIKKGKKK